MLKNEREQSLIDYQEKCKRIAESSARGVSAKLETPREKAARIEFLLSDYEAFCKYYFPDYVFAPFGWFHKEASSYLMQNWNTIGLMQWSREFGKSTHFNFLFPMFLLFRGALTGMMCGALNEKLAVRLLSDIRANLESNYKIVSDFGEQRGYGNWKEEHFSTKSGIAFYAFGSGQTPRGTKFGPRRPNYGTIDDFNDEETVRNDEISNDMYNWVREAFMPALSTKQWMLVVPQNRFHVNTVTMKFEMDKEVKNKYILRVDALNAKGESNYPEHFTTEEMIAKANPTSLAGMREYMNTPVTIGKVFKPDDIKYTKVLPINEYDIAVAYSDPSYKNSDRSDYKATALVGKTGDKYHLIKAYVQKADIRDMFLWHYEMDKLAGDIAIVRHCFEANFAQDMHSKMLDPLEQEMGYRLRMNEDKRVKSDKFFRISTLQPLFQSGKFLFNEAEKDDPDMLLMIKQFLGFQKGSRINDDGPDATESAVTECDTFPQRSATAFFAPRKKSKYKF
jgi:phage terminase large subunit-like protein